MLAHDSPEKDFDLTKQEGAMTAFRALYQLHWYRLYCIAFKATGSAQDAEELVQSLFEKIWKNRHTLTVKNWGAFLTVSLRNSIIDLHRQHTIRKKFLQSYRRNVAGEEQDVSGEDTTEERIDQEQLLKILEGVLDKLPGKTRTVFTLSRYQHKTVREIAGQLQLTEKAVEYHITKSLKLLRHHLRNFLHNFFNFF